MCFWEKNFQAINGEPEEVMGYFMLRPILRTTQDQHSVGFKDSPQFYADQPRLGSMLQHLGAKQRVKLVRSKWQVLRIARHLHTSRRRRIVGGDVARRVRFEPRAIGRIAAAQVQKNARAIADGFLQMLPQRRHVQMIGEPPAVAQFAEAKFGDL